MTRNRHLTMCTPALRAFTQDARDAVECECGAAFCSPDCWDAAWASRRLLCHCYLEGGGEREVECGEDGECELAQLKRHGMFQNTRFRLYCQAAARSVVLDQQLQDRALVLEPDFDVPAVLPQGALRAAFAAEVSRPLQLLRGWLSALARRQDTGGAPERVEEGRGRIAEQMAEQIAHLVAPEAYLRWWALCAANVHGVRLPDLNLELVSHVISCSTPCSPAASRQQAVSRIVQSACADFSPRCLAALFRCPCPCPFCTTHAHARTQERTHARTHARTRDVLIYGQDAEQVEP